MSSTKEIRETEAAQVVRHRFLRSAEKTEMLISESEKIEETPIEELIRNLLEQKDGKRLQRINDVVSIKLAMAEMSKDAQNIEDIRREKVLEKKKRVEAELHRHDFKMNSDVPSTIGCNSPPQDKFHIVPKSEEEILVAEKNYLDKFFKLKSFKNIKEKDEVMCESQKLINSHRNWLGRQCTEDCECGECNMKTGRLHTTFSLMQTVAFAAGDSIKFLPELHQVFKVMAGLEPASRDQTLSCLRALGDKCELLGLDIVAHLSDSKNEATTKFIKRCLSAREIPLKDVQYLFVPLLGQQPN